MVKLVPGTPFPTLNVSFVGGGDGPLVTPGATGLTIVDVYRGLHCPRCKSHLQEIRDNITAFKASGMRIVAVSTDPQDRAEQAAAEWALGDDLPIAYGLSLDDARSLGLAISQSIRDGETDRFAEPGVFFITAEGILYGSIIQTFPFARPSAQDLAEVGAVVKERNYPPRGTVAA